MGWELHEAMSYYKSQGAPQDQMVLIHLLKEIQEENGGVLSRELLGAVAEGYQIRPVLLTALIRRVSGLRLDGTHCLELCGGPNCTRQAGLAAFVEKTYGKKPERFALKYAGCMRLCGKGPNIRWDGVLHSGADEALIRKLVEENP